MRRLLGLLLLSVLSLPAVITSASAADPPKPEAAQPHAARKTWEQHFTEANAAHDGHLTLEEAKGGYPQIAKHFDDIDADHKGFVTQKDVRSWRVMRKAAHRLTKQPVDKLRPRPAVQRVYPELQMAPLVRKQVKAAATNPVAIL